MNDWKLMTDDAITQEERNVLGDFVCNSSRITQGKVVREFEQAWSEWLGCKYSVFVNSGSSANLLITRALSAIPNTRWVSQACTWSTAVSPIIQFSNLQLCDVDLTTLVLTWITWNIFSRHRSQIIYSLHTFWDSLHYQTNCWKCVLSMMLKL